jgi:hypothetical protein
MGPCLEVCEGCHSADGRVRGGLGRVSQPLVNDPDGLPFIVEDIRTEGFPMKTDKVQSSDE